LINFSSKKYTFRLLLFWGIVFLISILGTIIVYNFISIFEPDYLDIFIFFLYSFLSFQLAIGSTTFLFGYIINLLNPNYSECSITSKDLDSISLDNIQSAIIVPIYNENTEMVFDNLSVLYDNLQKLKENSNFDIFILSDTNDISIKYQEELKFIHFLKNKDAFQKIFYRNRKVNVNGKSGNIADFCRRWGNNYKYAIVLDADSYLDPKACVGLVKRMEENSNIGILQTMPKIKKSKSLFQKLFSFSNLVYGKYFSLGSSYWQLNSATFWGHNAIIRLAPFMKYCALPQLPKLGAIGGKILSHDTIEAALLKKEGYSTWFTTDDIKSYEEFPPTWIDLLKRDFRWCQGNLQHFWFLRSAGFKSASKFHIVNGIFSYLSSLIWLLFLLLTSIQFYKDVRYYRLALDFELWKLLWENEIYPKAITLQLFTLTLLFLPRILFFLNLIVSKNSFKISKITQLKLFFGEFLFSIVLAPNQMLYHTLFVLKTIVGHKIIWNAQNRNQNKNFSFLYYFNFFKYNFYLGISVGILLYYIEFYLFLWLIPIWGSWLLSPLIGFYTSKVKFKRENIEKEKPSLVLKKIINNPILFSIHFTFVSKGRTPNQLDIEFIAKIISKIKIDGYDGLSLKEIKRIYNRRYFLYELFIYEWKYSPVVQ
jgi:membrane glycosyltransferase